MKNKHFKRIISLMLVLVMLAGMIPLSAVQAGAQEDTGGSSQEGNGSDGYTYVERTWDAENSKIVESVEPLPYESFCYQGQDQLSSEVWYYIENTYTKIGRIRVVGHPKLILLDGSSLNVTEGIEIDPNSSLTIYGGEKGTGVLKAELDDKDYYAAIGGSKGKDAGKLIVKGGRVTASSSSDAPAIGAGGGDYFHFTGTVEVYGGKLIAKAGEYGSGIGAGYYGGIVETTGGKYGAGIGGGEGGSLNGIVNIYGGHVTVMGGKYASGIGGGQEWRGKGGHLNGAVNIYGGSVTTIGGYGGAGIGGGEDGHGGTVNISGGKVAAEGGDNAAGIGGGQDGNQGGTVTISGGDIKAIGGTSDTGFAGEGGAGIGGGSCGNGDTLNISGGEIYAFHSC